MLLQFIIAIKEYFTMIYSGTFVYLPEVRKWENTNVSKLLCYYNFFIVVSEILNADEKIIRFFKFLKRYFDFIEAGMFLLKCIIYVYFQKNLKKKRNVSEISPHIRVYIHLIYLFMFSKQFY